MNSLPSPPDGGNGPRAPGPKQPWAEVNASDPCPVCEKPDRCKIAPDGGRVMCFRVDSPDPVAGGQAWYHPHPAAPPRADRQPQPKQPAGPPPDFPKLAAELAAGLTPDRNAGLAAALGLPVESLPALPLAGAGADRDGAFWSLPEVDAGGCVIGIGRRYADGAKRAMRGGKRGLTVPAGWVERAGPVYLPEGPSDVLALTHAGLPAVGRPSDRGGVGFLVALLRMLPDDRPVVVLAENDAKPDGSHPGRTGAHAVAGRLRAALPGRCVVVMLPPAGAKDAREWLTSPDRGETPWPDRGPAFAAALVPDVNDPPADTGADTPTGPDDGRVTVVVGTDEHRVNAEASAALARCSDLFCRGAALVVVTTGTDGRTAARELCGAEVRDLLSRCVRFVTLKTNPEGPPTLVPRHPPDWCVANITGRADRPGVRVLGGVSRSPVFRADGSVSASPGYDPDTRLWVDVPAGVAAGLPDSPTPADAAHAAAELLAVVADFPFAGACDRAAWLAATLTLLARPAFPGPAPWFVVVANAAGSGKGLLCDVTGVIATGRPMARTAYTPDAAEFGKQVTGWARDGARLVLLDNLSGPVGNGTLDNALTATEWEGRVLGVTGQRSWPLPVTWFGTGNNVQFVGDAARRVCPVRLHTTADAPDARTDFRRTDLLAYVTSTRPRLLAAALTILRAWHVAGRPVPAGLAGWGSYTGWTAVVRAAVVFAGLPDPAGVRATARAADRGREVLTGVMDGWLRLDPDGRGVVIKAAVAAARVATDPDGWRSDFLAVMEEACGDKDPGRQLGYYLSGVVGRPVGGLAFVRAGVRGGVVRWAVRRIDESPATPADAPPAPDPGRPGVASGGIGGIPPAVVAGATKRTRRRPNAASTAADWNGGVP